MNIAWCFILCVFGAQNTNSARILGIFHFAAKSHHRVGEVLFKELAERGHEVVMASPYPLKTPMKNYVDIYLNETYNDMKERLKYHWFHRISNDYSNPFGLFMINIIGVQQAKLVFQNREIMHLIESKTKFDLIVMDILFNDMHYIFGHLFDCPVILSSSFGSGALLNGIVGNYVPYSYVSFKFFAFTDKMSLIERFFNAFLYTFTDIYLYFERSVHQSILNKYFPGAPNIYELRKRVALILSNGNYVLETPMPVVPNIIEVGGYHVEKVKPLPKDLKKFLDNSTEGAVLFSFGSNLKSVCLGEDVLKKVIRTFSRLHVKVLWKLEKELEGIPENIWFSEWLPQNDILAHPNIKAFVTHGGLLSTIESVYHGVPTVGIPMFADQYFNTLITEQFGSGVRLKASDLGEEVFYDAINEVLTNPRYAERAKLRSKLLHDQPIKPMDKAIYWVEHVIRHKGADHLVNGSMELNWYQKYLLDVLFVGLVVLLSVALIVYYVFKYSSRVLTYLFDRRCKKYAKKFD